MAACAVSVITTDDIGVVQGLEDLDLAVQHFQTRLAIFFKFNNLYCTLAVVALGPSSVNLATVTGTNLLPKVIGIVPNLPLSVVHYRRRGNSKF